jgi:tetratricopeptide (TPR) repeat protein
MGTRIFRIAAIVFFASTSYAAAQTAAQTQSTPANPQAAPSVSNAPADEHPWVKAEAVLKATDADARAGGIRGVASHVADLEQALADGKQAFGPPTPGTGPIYVLTDGSAETLLALLSAAADASAGKKNRDTHAIKNPYPLISVYLGSYYNEIGKHDDALRVLDEGMTLRSEPDLLGETVPLLISERGATLEALRRWDDALADYDKGLTIAAMPDGSRARLFRGRGYSLTELNRLDDAEEAYKNSLKLAPGNALALNELKYIAKLKAGGLREPAGNLTIPTAPKQQ